MLRRLSMLKSRVLGNLQLLKNFLSVELLFEAWIVQQLLARGLEFSTELSRKRGVKRETREVIEKQISIEWFAKSFEFERHEFPPFGDQFPADIRCGSVPFDLKPLPQSLAGENLIEWDNVWLPDILIKGYPGLLIGEIAPLR